MREILFRGKKLSNGEWIYGDLLSIPIENFYSILEQTPVAQNAPVKLETVGQFTGLTDKNGTKIFEGDIIKHYNYSGHPEHFCVYTVFYAEEDLTFRAREKVECGSAIYGLVNENTYEVIGNIHDNPELIEEYE